MRKWCVACAVVCGLLWAQPVAAQIPGLILITGSSTADFVASADHDAVNQLDGSQVVSGYRARYHLLDANNNPQPTPAFVTNLGKPVPGAGGVIVIPNAFGAIVPNTAYRLIVEAVGPGGVGVSQPSVPFGRATPVVPASPAIPRITP